MAIRLDDVVDRDRLTAALADGYVRVRHHPDVPLSILNYTAKCQYDRAWSQTTRACRGLIVTYEGRVVARPWPKFFNYEEHDVPFHMIAPVEVTDKMDGSLGILYPTWEGYAIATRGSFTSEQALRATAMLNASGSLEYVKPALTYLFEIVYPENRVVVDYGSREALILLGAVVTDTGEMISAADVDGWNGDRVPTFPATTFADALALEPRPNAEGIVVRYVKPPQLLVKIKQADYVALHRLVFGMNERTVWELLGAGKSVDEVCEPLPEEFWPWVRHVSNRLIAAALGIQVDALGAYCLIVENLDDPRDRKAFAAVAVKSPLRHYLFLLFDGKPIEDAIWQTLRPREPRPLVSTSEDVA